MIPTLSTCSTLITVPPARATSARKAVASCGVPSSLASIILRARTSSSEATVMETWMRTLAAVMAIVTALASTPAVFAMRALSCSRALSP